MVTGYISKDELILSYLDKYRQSNIIQSKAKIQSSQKLIQKGRKTMQKFIIDEDERDNIFDLIAEEHPDL
jgi:cellobiose-specific phosphotransferase system component IIA